MSSLLALPLTMALNSPVMKEIPSCTNLQYLYLELKKSLTISRLSLEHYCTNQPTDVFRTVQINVRGELPTPLMQQR